MITTYKRLNEATSALQAFYSQPQEYELRVKLVKQAEVFWSAIQAFQKFQEELRNTHMNKLPGQDNPMINSKEAANAYNAAILEFQSRKISLDIDPISDEMLRNIVISPLDHLALVRLFKNIESV